jgi:glycosyltransferase involved in cell wall biosynthesis
VPQPSIAFISTYSHPSRDSMERMLREAFPDFQLHDIELMKVVKANARWAPANALHAAAEFGGEVLAGRMDVRNAYLRTTYLMRKLRAAMPGVIDPRQYAFSFQTQSMYDTSVPGLPHFLYTDHTHLSNLKSAFFDRRTLRSKRWIALERGIYHNATRVFTRSTDVRADLSEYYELPQDKSVCVYAGNNVHVPADYAMDNDGYANQNVLFVGGDWERKGGPTLVEAFREVQKVHPRARLTIAGAEVNLDLPNCTVLGKVGLRELSQQYSRASIFCLPTLLEPFGIVFVEAMLHRLPVVATRGGALPDMVREGVTGHLVEPGDAKGLASVLIGLLGDPARCRSYAEAGYKHASETYTWPRVGERIRATILPLIEARIGANR